MIDRQSVSALDAWTAVTRPYGSVRGIVAPAVPDLSQEKIEHRRRRPLCLDEAESGHHVHVVVSAPSSDSGVPVRVELTAEGEVLHERLRAALDELTAELSAHIPRRDRQTAPRVLVEITREVTARLDSDLGVRFGQ
jgi:hypothetical protein